MQESIFHTVVELLVEDALQSTDKRVRTYLFTSAALLLVGNVAFAVMVGAAVNWKPTLFAASLLATFGSVFVSALCFLRGQWLSLKSRGALPPHAIWIAFAALLVIIAVPAPVLLALVLLAVVLGYFRGLRRRT